jgi:ribosomal protein S18 acetylase RimI-like enzyme
MQICAIEVRDNPRYPYKPNVPLTVLVNPVLTPVGDERFDNYEGCLSVPNLRGVVSAASPPASQLGATGPLGARPHTRGRARADRRHVPARVRSPRRHDLRRPRHRSHDALATWTRSSTRHHHGGRPDRLGASPQRQGQGEEEGIEQLIFEVDGQIVAYAECSFEVTGSDNWINPRYFEKRDMRPLFVDELAVHPDYHGRGVGSFVLEQLHHLARVNGLTHLVLEVAENNENALAWYKKRDFKKLDAAIFMACAIDTEPELLPPRALPPEREPTGD